MSLLLPVSGQALSTGNHLLMHRVIAIDSVAPVESLVIASSGYVGIGTTSPSYALDIVAGGAIRTSYLYGSSGLQLFGDPSSTGTQTLFLTTGGNVGIGTSSPAQALDVSGNILIESTNKLMFNNSNISIYGGSGTMVFTTSGLPVLNLDTDLYTNAWADYSGTSTIVGWVSISSDGIYTKKLGKFVSVQFNISGTSNSTSTTFTVPYSASSSPSSQFFMCLSKDNGGSLTSSYGLISANGAIVTIYPSASGTNWTASGTKSIYGSFTYQSA